MRQRVRLAMWLLIGSVCVFAAGCQDAVREGMMAGVKDGIAGAIESFIASTTSVFFNG